MYKALIVDDEKMIRNGIQAIIPWQKLEIGQVFTAASAKEALELIEQEKPDIMLTDICMTEVTGLELIEKINAANANIKIIVLTGYDNFEYVQQCCRMQVEDFFLKPADEDELTAAIKKVVDKLNQAKNDQQYQKIMSRAVGLSEQMKLEVAMRNLVHGRTRAEELGGLLEEYSYNPSQPSQIAILTPVLTSEKNWQEHNDLLTLSMKNICIEMFDSRREGITFEDDDGKIILAVFESNEFDEVVERVERLNDLLEDEYDINQKVVLGSLANGFSEMMISYNDAVHLLDNAREDIGEIIQSHHSERRLQMFNEIFMELKRIMISNIGDVDKVMKAFTTFEKSTRSYNLSNSFVRRSCFDIASALYFTYISDTGESVDNKLNSLLTSLLSCSREDACGFTRTFISQLFSREEENTHEIVSNAKRFIKDHLAEDLSVSSIAAQLFITPNYFSRLFKKVTGEGCNEYIVRKRIEKAKSLLETTSIKTGKIALMVGYRDTNYFSLAFKKHTGVAPTGFRDNLR